MKKFRLIYIVMAMAGSAMPMSNKKNDFEITKNKYVISANDQQFILTDGLSRVEENPLVGTITILDCFSQPPKAITLADIPCSVTGPPACVAITPDETIAIVAAAMKVDSMDPNKQVPDNRLTVIDLTIMKPIQTLTVGQQPSGVSITTDGKNALVCNRADGTMTALKIHYKHVSSITTIVVCEPEESLSHVVVSPDKSYALATLNKADTVLKIPLDKGIPQTNIERVMVGQGPYMIEFIPDGTMAAVANVNSNSISILDLDGDEIQVKDTINVGILPEGMDVSSDGMWIVASCLNNTFKKPDDSERQEHSELVLLKRTPTGYSDLQRMPVDSIAQSAVFSPDMKYVIVAGYEDKRLTLYAFENGTIKQDGFLIPVSGQPCTLRSAN